jgi:uncharacterized SAM-binding protein YcdF (DUF218 family)
MPPFRDLKRGQRLALALLCLATLTVMLVAAVPSWRLSVLQAAGWMLVAEDVPAKVDVIVISSDAIDSLGGLLEAADLVHAGLSTRVAIPEHRSSAALEEFSRRGVSLPNIDSQVTQLLNSLGVRDVVVIPSVVGTVDQGNVLQRWCAANGVQSVLFISAPDHSRRTRRVLERTLGRHGVHVVVRYARHSDFDPDSWWHSRGGQRTEAVESEKLLLDWLAHPF